MASQSTVDSAKPSAVNESGVITKKESEDVLVCGIPLNQGGFLIEGNEVAPPLMSSLPLKQFPSTIQKLPLLLKEEMRPMNQPATNAPGHPYGLYTTIPL